MGTGKSSVGHSVSAMLHFQFADTDTLVEARVGASIADIFAKEGELRFRSYESQVVRGLVHCRRTVISTGGGVILNPENLESLKAHSLVVCLWASVDTIYERVRSQSHRPLLQCEDPKGRIRELLAEREPFYRQADILLSTEFRTIREVAQQVINQLRLAQARAHSA